ncbi:NineTeen Complex (NTC) component [Tilletia horrida]|uniref:NineTeen Complex (NTC) component n=1 Tax=Tilletia horrida TaxID=155126 RepID=A0AAN6JSF2_9BASI|nr:NineTeen Complex (NTC) component [Tilletia horrida]KAK0529573.1 NineTeen Complex (NTC) component [Tilletia horrida]KAK0535812.1 NineTeen Complex (NTC) component [Tilletia horrida]KAK0567258.1 NineTeen Complex (NTC) component [Tilletia horrida]
MARNQEKAQSMLYRFREAQAAELGLMTRTPAHRPRLASSVQSVKEAERWRGEVMRDISRKVSKIQDTGLTDYEVRDLNDEINKLIREKGHWENQILALGGANYKRGMPKMLDDSGREVPGTRGYKYFGRAKDLPGVKELLTRTAEQEEELESFKSKKYKRFAGQPPSYYGYEEQTEGEDVPAEEGPEAVLRPEELEMPAMPDRKEMEAFLLSARKRALKAEYLGT